MYFYTLICKKKYKFGQYTNKVHKICKSTGINYIHITMRNITTKTRNVINTYMII